MSGRQPQTRPRATSDADPGAELRSVPRLFELIAQYHQLEAGRRQLSDMERRRLDRLETLLEHRPFEEGRRRRYVRAPFSMALQVGVGVLPMGLGTLLDLGAGGLRLLLGDRFPATGAHLLRLRVPGSSLAHRLTCILAWSQPVGRRIAYGLRFAAPAVLAG